jgi:hypothetical protein
MRITRNTTVAIAVIVLGITAFAYEGHIEHPNTWPLTAILPAAMLLATGVLLVAAEVKNIWFKSHGSS